MEIKQLQWDTDFFGVLCGKIVLDRRISEPEWLENIKEFDKFDFISVQNSGNDIDNNYLINRYTTAFLVDINVQFEKHVCPNERKIKNEIKIVKADTMSCYQEEFLSIMDRAFGNSKFVCDKQLQKRNGEAVYKQWLLNAMKDADMKMVVCEIDKQIKGYILFAVEKQEATIELIAVDEKLRGEHIGSEMLLKLEQYLAEKEVQILKVGTQLNNKNAMNFYCGNGFRQKGCMSVYHWWRENMGENICSVQY